jgi:hypothetical protein
MNHVLTVLGAILGAVVCAVTGAYVLRHYPGSVGLAVGVGLILLGLAIAVPVQLTRGSVSFKDSIIVVVTQAKNALAGGRRSDDPPATPNDKGTG